MSADREHEEGWSASAGGSGALTTMGLGLDPPVFAAAPEVIADRYRVEGLLGSGGAGQVFRAFDTLAGRPVAVKWLFGLSRDHLHRVRREVAALRALRVPGVVRLLDEGADGGHRFLVMELVEGRPFPGCRVPAAWPRVRPTALALLETLARVHQAGVVHRDLKPANVLVREDGQPVILDFGLARGREMGETITRQGAVLGTPRYQAPEQVLGEAADARADLYAVGVMLYEALSGHPPHPGRSVEDVLRSRLDRSTVPLAERVPGLPLGVAAAVDRMLARRPEDRFPTALDALAALRDEDLGAEAPLPRLGGGERAAAVVAAARAGRSVDVVGPRGTGRSTVLREAAARLAAEGRKVHRLGRGSAPFESLRGLGPAFAPGADEGLGALRDRLAARLSALLDRGDVLLADPIEGLDRRSRALVDALRERGAVIAAAEEPAGGAVVVRTRPWSVEELRPLFAGPDRVLHLVEDGARVLWERTEGVASRVAAEVAAWVRAGIARRREDGRLAVDRGQLDLLRGEPVRLVAHAPVAGPDAAPIPHEADEVLAWVQLAGRHATAELVRAASGWPAWRVEDALDELARLGAVRLGPGDRLEARRPSVALQLWDPATRQAAHLVLARAIPPGAPGRLLHLLLGADREEVAAEALRQARRLRLGGDPGAALALLRPALAAVRDAVDPRAEAALLVEWADVAMALHTAPAMERARYELERSGSEDPRLPVMIRALDASLAALAGGGARALAILGDPPGDLPLPVQQRWWTARVTAALRTDADTLAAVVAEARRWSRGKPPEIRAVVTGWEGLLAARRGQHAEAARLALASAEGRADRSGRFSALLNAAAALLWDRRPREALAAAERVRAEAEAGRNVGWEGRAELLARAARYRAGEQLAPDEELVEALAVLGGEDLLGFGAMTEAAFAWRGGEGALADRLARRAEAAYRSLGMVEAAAMARALALAATGPHPEAVLADAWTEALRSTGPMALQALGLLLLAGRGGDAEARAVVRARLAGADARRPEQRQDVLSLDELRAASS